MMKKYLLAGILILAVSLSGCERMYAGAEVAVTPSPTGAFAGQAAQQTMAVLQTQSSSQSTPQAPNLTAAAMTGTVVVNGTAITPQTQITFTSTPLIGGVTTTAGAPTTPAAGVTPQAAATTAVPPTTIVGRPATYILQSGEFPYCIARRFNVDPDELLSISGLSAGVLYPAGTALKIPQSGTFPGDRALRSHPATYTVTGDGDTTIYAVACIFGDVDPASIAQRNNLSISAQLSVGQQIAIP